MHFKSKWYYIYYFKIIRKEDYRVCFRKMIKYNIKNFLGTFFYYKKEQEEDLEEYFKDKIGYDNGRLEIK